MSTFDFSMMNKYMIHSYQTSQTEFPLFSCFPVPFSICSISPVALSLSPYFLHVQFPALPKKIFIKIYNNHTVKSNYKIYVQYTTSFLFQVLYVTKKTVQSSSPVRPSLQLNKCPFVSSLFQTVHP